MSRIYRVFLLCPFANQMVIVAGRVGIGNGFAVSNSHTTYFTFHIGDNFFGSIERARTM